MTVVADLIGGMVAGHVPPFVVKVESPGVGVWDVVGKLAPLAAVAVAWWAIRASQRAQFDRERRTALADLIENLLVETGDMVLYSERVARVLAFPEGHAHREKQIAALDEATRVVDKLLKRLRVRLGMEHPIVRAGREIHDTVHGIRIAAIPAWSDAEGARSHGDR